MSKPRFKKNYDIRYIRLTGENDGLLMERKLFGTVGPWQKAGHFNNEVFRIEAEMNEIRDKFVDKYTEYKRIIKKRNGIHDAIEKAVFQPEGVGSTISDQKLPIFRKDKEPLEKPPNDWFPFARVIKGDVSIGIGDGASLSTSVVLADNSAGDKDYDITPRNDKGGKNSRRNGNKNQQGGQG